MILFQNVSKIYNDGSIGLQSINLTVDEGERIALIGLSGSGKSTFLKAINRIIDISEGEIFIDGQSISHANLKQLKVIRRHIGLVSQSFNLVKRSSVLRNVLSGRLGYTSTLTSILSIFSESDYKKVDNALKSVGLLDKKFARCDELSGGQQQRVSIARTLVQEANIILADEPISALDPVTSDQIMTHLKNINQKNQTTIIVNLHSVEIAKNFATRIIGLKRGKIVFDDVPHALKKSEIKYIYQAELKSEIHDEN